MPRERRATPARRVYYDWDAPSTNPDLRLVAAFERTQPGVEFDDEDAPTLVRWALPALGALIGGFLLGRWWARRPQNVALVGVDALRRAEGYMDGFDLLGATP